MNMKNKRLFIMFMGAMVFSVMIDAPVLGIIMGFAIMIFAAIWSKIVDKIFHQDNDNE